MGAAQGAITFVARQAGEIPDFYDTAPDVELADVGEVVTEPTGAELLQSATPESVESFIEEFEIPAAPEFPTVSPAAASVVAGRTVDIVLDGHHSSGPVSYAIDSTPTLGTVIPTASGLRYTAGTASGTDSFTVRALGPALGSEPAMVTVTVQPAPAPSPRPTATTLTAAKHTIRAGKRMRLTVQVHDTAGATAPGAVRIYDGHRVVATVRFGCGPDSNHGRPEETEDGQTYVARGVPR